MYSSRVYIGHTGHSRLAPVKHTFRYPVNYYVFDLDELQKLSDNSYLFGYNKSRPISIYDDDYLGREVPGTSIKQKVNAILKERRVDPTPISRIELVTSARYFGHAFNPVNFYYCYHNVADKINAADQSLDSASNNEQLYAMVVEINNTFGETHVHVIKSDERALPLNATEDPYQNKKLTKSTFAYNYVRWRDFHVSPFNDRQGYFHFQFADVRKELHVKISQTDASFNSIVVATLRGDSCYSLCDSVIAKNIVRYPVTALMTFPRILVQAGKLHFRKKLPIYVKPNPTQPDTIILIPPGALQLECMTRVIDAWSALFSTKAALLPVGSLSVQLPDGKMKSFGFESSTKPNLELKVVNYDFFNRIYEQGSFGSALAFMAEDFSCPPHQLRDWLAFLHTTSKATSVAGAQSDNRPLLKNGNKLTVPESTAQEHFLASFLDPTMSFHCPSFDKQSIKERPVIDISELQPKSLGPQSLESAQIQGINQLLDLVVIKSEHKVLDLSNGKDLISVVSESHRKIGWGAITAVLEERNIGCSTTCVVLTVQQLLHVRKRLPANSNVSVILFEDFIEQNASAGSQSFDVIFAVESSEMHAAYMTHRRVQSRAGRSAAPVRQELHRFFELCYSRLEQGGQLVVQSVHRVADTRPAEIKNQLSSSIVRPSIASKYRMQNARVSRWMEIKLFEHITEYVINPFELDNRFHRNFSFVPNVRIISAPDAVPGNVDIIAAATGSKLTMESMKDLGSTDYALAYQSWANNLDQARVDIRASGSVTLYDNAVNSERDRQLGEELKRQFRYYLKGAQHMFELGLFGVSRFVFSKQM